MHNEYPLSHVVGLVCLYPSLHVQLKEPGVFVHVAIGSGGHFSRVSHSLSSITIMKAVALYFMITDYYSYWQTCWHLLPTYSNVELGYMVYFHQRRILTSTFTTIDILSVQSQTVPSCFAVTPVSIVQVDTFRMLVAVVES